MMGYKVLVYENNHYRDENERIDYGVFPSAQTKPSRSPKRSSMLT
jgi:hypothetical protein